MRVYIFSSLLAAFATSNISAIVRAVFRSLLLGLNGNSATWAANKADRIALESPPPQSMMISSYFVAKYFNG